MNFNSEMWGAVTTIFLAIIGVASLAVFFSKNANTAAVIQNSFSGLSNSLTAAEAPVTGNNAAPNYQYVGSSAAPLTNDFAY